MRNLRSAPTLVAVLVAVGLGCARQTPPSVPVASFPELDPGRPVTVRPDALARDAVRPTELRTVLESAGFATGSERTFVGREGVRSVTARVLVFETAGGAASYLGWVQVHASDLLGASTEEPALDIDGVTARVFSHAPGGCCPKAMTSVLAAWRRGEVVMTLLAKGPDVRGDALEGLVSGFDRAAVTTATEGG